MSKGQIVLVLLLLVLNIPVLYLGLNEWHSTNVLLCSYVSVLLVVEFVAGLIASVDYIIENW